MIDQASPNVFGAPLACATCKFFVPPSAQESDLIRQGMGKCHRYPPRVDHALVGLDPEKGPEFHRLISHAITSMSNWCGEYQRKVAAGQFKKLRS